MYIYIHIYVYIYIIQTNQICFKKSIYIQNIKTGETWKCEALKNMCQFCLINRPWKSKLPPSGETCEWWNLGTLKPNTWRIPQLKEIVCYHWISSVFPTVLFILSWCLMSFDCPFLHCILKFSVVFLTKVYIVTSIFISFLPPTCDVHH